MSDYPTDRLCDEYVAWNKAQGLCLGSADEHLFDEDLSDEQRAWLADFCRRWEAAAAIERLRYERDAAAARGDHAEALILNDRIRVLKPARNAHVAEPFRSIVNAFSEPRK